MQCIKNQLNTDSAYPVFQIHQNGYPADVVYFSVSFRVRKDKRQLKLCLNDCFVNDLSYNVQFLLLLRHEPD